MTEKLKSTLILVREVSSRAVPLLHLPSLARSSSDNHEAFTSFAISLTISCQFPVSRYRSRSIRFVSRGVC